MYDCAEIRPCPQVLNLTNYVSFKLGAVCFDELKAKNTLISIALTSQILSAKLLNTVLCTYFRPIYFGVNLNDRAKGFNHFYLVQPFLIGSYVPRLSCVRSYLAINVLLQLCLLLLMQLRTCAGVS